MILEIREVYLMLEYMRELTINNETAEWVIDTGGNPEGVKIRKYNNGWWNGEHFYGFGRLKE